MQSNNSIRTVITISNDTYIIEILNNKLYLAKNDAEIKRPNKKRTLLYIADRKNIDLTLVGSGTQSLGWKIIKDNNTRRLAA